MFLELITSIIVLFCIYIFGIIPQNIKKLGFQSLIRISLYIVFVLKPEDRLRFFRKLHYVCPGSVRLKFLNRNVLICYDPEVMKKILLSSVALERPFMEYVKLDAGIICTKYHKWKVDRKQLNLAFNLKVLKGFIPVHAEKCEAIIKDLQVHVDGKEFNVMYYTFKLTIRTVLAAILSLDGYEPDFDKGIQALDKCCEAVFRRMIIPVLHPEWIYKQLNFYRTEMLAREYFYAIGEKLLANFKKEIEQDKIEGRKRDFKFLIEFFVNENGTVKFSDIEISEHILTFLITGVETSTNLLANAILYLAINSNIQDDLYEEIKDVFGSGDVGVDLEYEKINRLELLDRVVKETLRLSSPLPISLRKTCDDLDYGEGVLPKGTHIVLYNYLLHTRKDIWGANSLKFDPDNFLPENTAKRHPYSFVPFGVGARNCIGNRYAMISIKVNLIKILQIYQFSSSLKEKDLKFKLAFSSKLAQDHMVSIKKRI